MFILLRNILLTINNLIQHHARYRSSNTAIVFGENRLTYGQFYERVNRLGQALLDIGLQKGDKVATLLPNCLEVLDIYWAAAQIGLVVVPLSTMLRGQALVTLLNDSDTVAIFGTQDLLDHLMPLRAKLPLISPDRYIVVGLDHNDNLYTDYHHLMSQSSPKPTPEVPIEPDDLYNIIYSSGTTGSPKGIIHTHFVRSIYCLTFATSFRITPESIICHAGSLAFNGSFLTLMPTFFQGATYVLMSHFDVDTLIDTIATEKVTHIVMVPSQIIALLNSSRFDAQKLKSLEMICTVGAPLHLEHKEKLNRLLPGVFYELYGLTEGFSTILDKTMYASKPNSVGVPPPMHQLKICDEQGNTLSPGQVGEVVGRGPKTMAGYYKRPDLTQQVLKSDGWLFTGDLGYVDEDGYLYLVDRKKDMIISGGVNVYPRDIEEIIVKHPAVREAAVFGVPHERWGETPLAAVILHDNQSVSAETLREWINEHVDAAYQRVAAVILCDDFPRSVAGKTLKRMLREEFLQQET